MRSFSGLCVRMGTGLLGQVTVEGVAGTIFYALLSLRKRDFQLFGHALQFHQRCAPPHKGPAMAASASKVS